MNAAIKTLGILLVTLLTAPDPKPSPALAGIAHVAFRVTDVAKSREFYRTLGFEEAFGFADPGKPPVSYVKVNDRQFIELYGRADDFQPLGLMHLCYEANDIDAAHDYYVEHDVKAPPAKKARAGNLLFTFHDPEGQIVEFTQYMPGSLHYGDRGKHLSDRRVSQRMLRPTIAVKDLEVVRSFYTSKLGFENLGTQGVDRLGVPGGSGDEIELETATSRTKPRLAFTVKDVKRTADDLRRRGFAVRKDGDSAFVTDPDGAMLIFVTDRDGKKP